MPDGIRHNIAPAFLFQIHIIMKYENTFFAQQAFTLKCGCNDTNRKHWLHITIDVDECKTITITGDCRRVKTNMGDINVGGNVDGDVHTNMGSIECGNVGGDAHTNMGSVHYRRD